MSWPHAVNHLVLCTLKGKAKIYLEKLLDPCLKRTYVITHTYTYT